MSWTAQPQDLYLFFTPATTTVGPLNMTLKFQAMNFVDLPRGLYFVQESKRQYDGEMCFLLKKKESGGF